MAQKDKIKAAAYARAGRKKCQHPSTPPQSLSHKRQYAKGTRFSSACYNSLIGTLNASLDGGLSLWTSHTRCTDLSLPVQFSKVQII